MLSSVLSLLSILSPHSLNQNLLPSLPFLFISACSVLQTFLWTFFWNVLSPSVGVSTFVNFVFPFYSSPYSFQTFKTLKTAILSCHIKLLYLFLCFISLISFGTPSLLYTVYFVYLSSSIFLIPFIFTHLPCKDFVQSIIVLGHSGSSTISVVIFCWE